MMRVWIDRCWRAALVVAYAGLRAYWFAMRPKTHGVYVAVWVNGKLLLIRNSYRSKFSLPGGAVDRGEAELDAAVRELHEEVGISVAARDLRLAKTYVIDEDHHEDHTSFFEIEMERTPVIAIDRREVIWAEFRAPEELKRDSLVTPLRFFLEDRLQ